MWTTGISYICIPKFCWIELPSVTHQLWLCLITGCTNRHSNVPVFFMQQSLQNEGTPQDPSNYTFGWVLHYVLKVSSYAAYSGFSKFQGRATCTLVKNIYFFFYNIIDIWFIEPLTHLGHTDQHMKYIHYSEVPNNHRGHNNSIGCHLRQESIIVQGTIIVEADNLLTI